MQNFYLISFFLYLKNKKLLKVELETHKVLLFIDKLSKLKLHKKIRLFFFRSYLDFFDKLPMARRNDSLVQYPQTPEKRFFNLFILKNFKEVEALANITFNLLAHGYKFYVFTKQNVNYEWKLLMFLLFKTKNIKHSQFLQKKNHMFKKKLTRKLKKNKIKLLIFIDFPFNRAFFLNIFRLNIPTAGVCNPNEAGHYTYNLRANNEKIFGTVLFYFLIDISILGLQKFQREKIKKLTKIINT